VAEGVIVLGGMRWRALQVSTIEHDLWIMRKIRDSGLDAVKMEAEERPDEFALRILDAVLMSGQALWLVAGTIVGEGKADTDWTPEMAEANYALLRTFTSEEDKAVFRSAIISLLSGFFAAGLSSANSFVIASVEQVKKASAEGRPEKKERVNMTPYGFSG